MRLILAICHWIKRASDTTFLTIRNAWIFWRDFGRYNRLAGSTPRAQLNHIHPCLHDNGGETPIDPVYMFQDYWAFERIVKAKPSRHVDIGSHHKFVALLSVIVPVEMMDLRPWPLDIRTVAFRHGSILDLDYPDSSVSSISCLCVVEHIGLGRYGDPLDPHGSEKALAELKRVLAPEGDLYLSIPIDDVSRIYFNAHRAFSISDLEKLFDPLQIVDRAFIYGNELIPSPGEGFGTACYHLRRQPLP